jgi:hypothetical protein
MNILKRSFWVTLLCVFPYAVFFGWPSKVGWLFVIVMATAIAWATMYYVLLKAPTLPKKIT